MIMTKDKSFKIVGNMYMGSHILVNTHKTTQATTVTTLSKSNKHRIYTHTCIVN